MTTLETGCYVGGHWGQYGIARMVTLAADLGYADTVDIALAQRKLAAMMPSDAPALSQEDEEKLYWAGDAAEIWLNENVAPDGYAFGWHDGEFFLQSLDWWNEDV